MICFINNQSDIIRIPPGITIRNVNDNSIVRPSRRERWFNVISRAPSYEIYHNNVHIISFDNQRQTGGNGE